MSTPVSADTISAFLDADCSGPPTTVTGVASLSNATETALAFSTTPDGASIEDSDAGVVVCPTGTPSLPDRTLVRVDNPKRAFVRAYHEFFAEPREETYVHPTAVVADGAELGARCYVGPHVYVDDSVRVGDDVSIHAGTALGCPGFGFARLPSGRPLRQVHQGTVVVEDGVAIGPNCSVDRAVFDETVVREGAALSANVHLAHQVEVGRFTTMAYGCGVSGSTVVGEACTFHPNVSVADHLTVGDRAEVGIGSTVLDDVPAGATVVGTPAEPL